MVAVVDSDSDRYAFLAKICDQGRACARYFADGRSTLRLSGVFDAPFWLVNEELADMRGIDCIEMLVELYPDSRFFLIADQYNADDERMCFRFARVKYLCRPLDSQWLGRLLQSAFVLPKQPSQADGPSASRPDSRGHPYT
jgi:two-component SAPR family response regulator